MSQPASASRQLVVLLACLLLAPVIELWAEDTMPKLEAKLAREKRPAERARLTARLAALQLDELTTEYRRGRLEAGMALLEKCVAGIESATQGLASLPANDRRKSKGYRELEIAVRGSIRQLRDLSAGLAFDDREPIEAAVARLEVAHRKLLGELFESLQGKRPRKAP